MKNAVLAFVLAATACVAAAAVPPEDSVYRLSLEMTDHAGKPAGLDRYRGRPVLVSMFYASCPHVCPMLISTIQRMERELPEAQRGKLRVLMVSLDPERDTPLNLNLVAERHRADLARWTFARVDESGVRKLAAVLNVQYRKLPDGEFNHSTVITVLDDEGRIAAQTSQMMRLDPEFLDSLRKAVSQAR